MAKYTFLCVPAWGHVNPTLAIVQELVKRGHSVSYYLTEEFRTTVQATGANFQPYRSMLATLAEQRGGESGDAEGNNDGLVMLMEDMRYVPPQIIDRIRAENPDVIVYDFMCAWAKPLVETLRRPAITTRATYASNEQFNILEHMQKLPGAQDFVEGVETKRASSAKRDGVSVDTLKTAFSLFSNIEQLNIIFMPRFFQPMEKAFDERYVFVGPSILQRHQETAFPFDQLSDERPLLYISMGTVATEQATFYQYCFEAFRDTEWQVVLSTGSTGVIQSDSVPENFLLSSYVPQLDILARARIFVTHAGANSVMEGMYYGVPMVFIPQNPEQYLNARRAVELGSGLLLEQTSVTAATLHKAVDHIAQNTVYDTNAQSLQKATHDAGGYIHAVDAIVQFTQEHAG